MFDCCKLRSCCGVAEYNCYMAKVSSKETVLPSFAHRSTGIRRFMVFAASLRLYCYANVVQGMLATKEGRQEAFDRCTNGVVCTHDESSAGLSCESVDLAKGRRRISKAGDFEHEHSPKMAPIGHPGGFKVKKRGIHHKSN